MRQRARTYRRRGAGIVAVTLATLSAAVLTACDSSSQQGGRPGSASSRPTPSPSPTPPWDRTPRSLAAVGDSITRGFDACSLFTDCPEVSWATGTDTRVNSLALRLLGPAGAAARSWNHARSGADVADLPAQMALAAAHKPELVTVMVGANDACADTMERMTPVETFRASFEASMSRLRKDAPKAQVYVSSVPDLKRLWSTGRADPVGSQIWKLGICASMLGEAEDDSLSAQQRRDAVRQRIVAYNEVLEDVCAEDDRCRYDGGAVFDYRFSGQQLSRWDWFHPSRDGQERLAEIAYRNVTAAKPPAGRPAGQADGGAR
ncbi:SGNH/GDSL hydrolase family protein [Streptomyces sp. PKU-EA00015]|uniref:GDSL-type esterase/lipase family protein n=1 Tax=Streptomyces sp. PKU-EA00015 TaxID=2748326 RepID=UPI00159FCB0E|nr:GDSL-type esterase/lipase family protein [Streptomyces sp. PKU-EA00015]NWF30974.1 SGNH/GDSL hydrolase family protein [Streptomyces sp. PKU-EA00015]